MMTTTSTSRRGPGARPRALVRLLLPLAMAAVGGGGVEVVFGEMVDLSTNEAAAKSPETAVSAPVIVDMSTIDAWKPYPADGVTLELANDDGALRMDFAFTGGGYAIARSEVSIDLPENYAITFRVRGQTLPQHLELKLIDETNENVYWHVRRDFAFPTEWTEQRTKKRQISFAWGPGGGDKPLRHIRAIEFAVTAGSGGTGSVWIDDLKVVPMPVSSGPVAPPTAEANSQREDRGPDLALDGDPNTMWESGRNERMVTYTLDFGREQEFGGLTIDWAPHRCPAEYLIETDIGDGRWRPVLQVTGSDGGRDDLYLPESEAVRVRLRELLIGPESPAITELKVQPLAWSATREAFLMNLAREARRGLYPRGFLGEPTAWTVVGQDFDTREGLIGGDGALEAGPGKFSLEPFLWSDGKLVTWNDAQVTQTLVDEYLPMPQVTWNKDNWRLTLTAAGAGEPEQSYMLARYRVENRGARADTVRLYLALRPLQVNPPSQFLNIRGGAAKVAHLERQGDQLWVNGTPGVQMLTKPDGFGASTFFAGDIVADWLEQGRQPTESFVSDEVISASGALWWDLVVPAGKAREVFVAVPLHDELAPEDLDVNAELKAVAKAWHKKLDGKKLKAPKNAPDKDLAMEAIKSAKAQIGWILVNRAGPGIQPGTRSYARSWIRDGALTGEALLRMDRTEEVRQFLEWYAPHQYENGKIPCVVDVRGADPVPEHDSTGEFIFLVAQYWRHSHDRAVLDAMWPRVRHGVAYLESLLETRRTAEYQAEGKRHFYGILPPSISHEGYSAKPMHSYWDDFFCLRGLKDAAWLAEELAAAGVDSVAPEVARLGAARDRFAGDLKNSIAAAMAVHGIDYVPGCADLGDFDATSTTIALDPCEAEALLPAGALDRTFDIYWSNFSARRGGGQWKDFTPYEVRCIGAFARLGRDEQAWEMVEWFLSQQAVPGWKVWGEVVHRDKTEARFIGDMPHGWVGSDFVRSMEELIAGGPR
jgi:hypothetical protein